MPTYYDADGNEVEAFPKEEYEKLNNTVAELTKKIEEGGMSDQQKQRLIEDKRKLEQEKEDLLKNTNEKISKLEEVVVGGFKKEIFRKLSNGNEEFLKKMELEFDGFSGEALTQEQITERAHKAYILAGGEPVKPGFLDGMNSVGDRGNENFNKGTTEESENSKQMRKVFGIPDAVVEKYKDKI
jgi:hypothetical protein